MADTVLAAGITIWLVWGGYETVQGRLFDDKTLITLVWWFVLFVVVLYFGASVFHFVWVMPLIYLMAYMVTVNSSIQAWVMSLVMMTPLMASLALFG